MNTKQEIARAYKNLLVIKRIMMFLGIISTFSLVFTFYIKDKSMLVMSISLIVFLISIIMFVLLWYSVPKIRTYILRLSDEV